MKNNFNFKKFLTENKLNENLGANNILSFLNKYNLLDIPDENYDSYSSETPPDFGPGFTYEDFAQVDVEELEDELYYKFYSLVLDFLSGKPKKSIPLSPVPLENYGENLSIFPKGKMMDRELEIERRGEDGLDVYIKRSVLIDKDLWAWWKETLL